MTFQPYIPEAIGISTVVLDSGRIQFVITYGRAKEIVGCGRSATDYLTMKDWSGTPNGPLLDADGNRRRGAL